MKKLLIALFITVYSVSYAQDNLVGVDTTGKGNGSFVPDIAHCLNLLKQPATRKSVESVLPEFTMFGVLGSSYTYQFEYKDVRIKLWAVIKPKTPFIESLQVTFIGASGFNVVNIQSQLNQYGFTYNMRDSYNAHHAGIFGCDDCNYYEAPSGRYVALHTRGDFSIHNK